MSNGKSDKRRPTNTEVYNKNYDDIFRKKDSILRVGCLSAKASLSGLKKLQDKKKDKPKKDKKDK